jgi:hypothetical protein
MENLALWYRRFGEPETVLQPETAPLGALAPDISACGCCFLRSTRPILSPSPAPIATEPVTGGRGV